MQTAAKTPIAFMKENIALRIGVQLSQLAADFGANQIEKEN
jgi:hypothetical protein